MASGRRRDAAFICVEFPTKPTNPVLRRIEQSVFFYLRLQLAPTFTLPSVPWAYA